MAVNVLVKVIDQREERPFLTIPAIDALGMIGDERAVKRLVTLLGNVLYQAEAARALGDNGGKEAEKPLREIAKETADWPTRLWATYALAKLGDEQALGVLLESLQDRSREVRTAAVIALGRLRDKRAVEPLFDMLSDEYAGTAAANALVLIGGHEIAESLIEIVGRDTITARNNAANALRRISDKDFGLDYEKWKAWYEENRDK